MSATHSWPAASVQSDKLMQIVTVVYGVSLTSALTRNSDLILHPFGTNLIQFLCLACAALLSCYAFFAYVMAVSYDHPYDVRWTVRSSKSGAALRFATDLALAALYVRMLFVAVNATSSPTPAHPDLRSFYVSVATTMGVAFVVRVVRYKVLRRGLPSLGVGVLATIAAIHWGRGQSHSADLAVLVVSLVIVAIYIAANDFLGWWWWLDDVSKGKLPSGARDKARETLTAAGQGLSAAPPAAGQTAGSGDAVVQALRAALRGAEQALVLSTFQPAAADVAVAKARRDKGPFGELPLEAVGPPQGAPPQTEEAPLVASVDTMERRTEQP